MFALRFSSYFSFRLPLSGLSVRQSSRPSVHAGTRTFSSGFCPSSAPSWWRVCSSASSFPGLFTSSGTTDPFPQSLTTRSSERRGLVCPFFGSPFLPPSLSLEALGALPLCSVFGRHVCSRSIHRQRLFPFAPWSRFASRGRRPLRSAFPGGSARHSPAGGRLVPVPQTPSSTRLTRRSSERRLAGELFLYSTSCVASLRR